MSAEACLLRSQSGGHTSSWSLEATRTLLTAHLVQPAENLALRQPWRGSYLHANTNSTVNPWHVSGTSIQIIVQQPGKCCTAFAIGLLRITGVLIACSLSSHPGLDERIPTDR